MERTHKMDIEIVINHLLANQKKFADHENFSSLPGIYAFFFNGGFLPNIESEILENEIIYIGKTESSQKKRNAQTHFKSGKTGSSTVRKSIGSILKEEMQLMPIPRNDTDFARGRLSHFKFDERSEIKLTDWMKSHLSVSYFEFPKPKQEIEDLETSLIHHLVPILNIDKNPENTFKDKLKTLRKNCAREAHESI